MSSSQLKLQLNEVVLSMLKEGIVDSKFTYLQTLQDADAPNFMAEVMTLYCKGAETVMLELTKKLSQKDLELCSLDQHIHRIKGSSLSMGAMRMAHACIEIQEAYYSGNKEGCLNALNKMVFEYQNLQSKFQTLIQEDVHAQYLSSCCSILKCLRPIFMQLETAIFDIESNQQFDSEQNKSSAKST